MLFPDNEAKRRAHIANIWQNIYPIYEKTAAGPQVPRSVLLSVMEAAAAVRIERSELADRWCKGLIAGELLKVLFAIAQTEPKRASWKAATRLVRHATMKSEAYLYEARRQFLSVIHLWAALILRGKFCHADAYLGYDAADDLHVFIAEAMALLQWGTQFTLDREKATPTLDRGRVDFWIPPPGWIPPTPAPGWPRDGRVPAVMLEPHWVRRIGSEPPTRRKKPLQSSAET